METLARRDPTGDGPARFLRRFLDPGADLAALTEGLRPTAADCAAYFVEGAAERAAAAYAEAWDSGAIEVAPGEGQTALLLRQATTEELQAWPSRVDDEFPGGYRGVARLLRPGHVVFAFKFVEPGSSLGTAYDGLVFLGGRWVLFPKPWRCVG